MPGIGLHHYEADRICTGFSFGSRRTQRISARIYDKTAEMEAKGTDWWEAVWGERHREGVPVWRIEFEIGRGALTELGLFTPHAVLASVPSLWRYCSTEWLSLRSSGPDSNRSRWPVAAEWEAVRSASLVHGATELSFIRRAQASFNLPPPPPWPRRLPGWLRRRGGHVGHRRHGRGADCASPRGRDHSAGVIRPTDSTTPRRRGLPMSGRALVRVGRQVGKGGRREAPAARAGARAEPSPPAPRTAIQTSPHWVDL